MKAPEPPESPYIPLSNSYLLGFKGPKCSLPIT